MKLCLSNEFTLIQNDIKNMELLFKNLLLEDDCDDVTLRFIHSLSLRFDTLSVKLKIFVDKLYNKKMLNSK
jgi:hypothetical protein